MSKKKEITLTIVGVLTLVVIVIGSSYAYYVSRTNSDGSGSNVDVRTATLGDTTVTTEGSIGFSDTNIYPGHKNISKIKVTATGDKNVLYNLTWTGTNTLNTPLKYYVYKTTTEETPTITCTKKEEGTIETHLYEECVNNNFDNLGEVVKEGTIETTETSSITKLIKNEEIQATSSGSTVYYYIVLEYENTESEQNIDMNGTFNGVVNTTLLEKKEGAKEQILTSKTILSRNPYIYSTLTDNTTGNIYTAEDDDGTSYYFAGAVDNNWVKFGQENGQDLYWRIVRINGDETIRIMYNGVSMVQKGVSTVINNGTAYKFNLDSNDNAYVGYMYGTAGSSTYEETHANINSSNVKQVVDSWYKSNMYGKNYEKYIDIYAGFCGDRSVVPNVGTGLGYGNEGTSYGASDRLHTEKKPSLKCPNSNDLYTTNGSNKGNKALTYPVGLITADEVVLAGGMATNVSNMNYYFCTGQEYWTMSPTNLSVNATAFYMYYDGKLMNHSVGSENTIRPVINLKSDVRFTGDGTTTNPYQIVE